MEVNDYNLERFIDAHNQNFQQALLEIRAGEKRTHWMWFIFPQLAGLGSSKMAKYYALDNLAHASAYLEVPLLRKNTTDICNALLLHSGKAVGDIFGYPDTQKLHSSMTLFSLTASAPSCCTEILENFYAGKQDQRTLELL